MFVLCLSGFSFSLTCCSANAIISGSTRKRKIVLLVLALVLLPALRPISRWSKNYCACAISENQALDSDVTWNHFKWRDKKHTSLDNFFCAGAGVKPFLLLVLRREEILEMNILQSWIISVSREYFIQVVQLSLTQLPENCLKSFDNLSLLALRYGLPPPVVVTTKKYLRHSLHW